MVRCAWVGVMIRRTQFWKEVFTSALAGAAGQCLQTDAWLIQRATALADAAQAQIDAEAQAAKKLKGTVAR